MQAGQPNLVKWIKNLPYSKQDTYDSDSIEESLRTVMFSVNSEG